MRKKNTKSKNVHDEPVPCEVCAAAQRHAVGHPSSVLDTAAGTHVTSVRGTARRELDMEGSIAGAPERR
jgi:hypothetical protein